MAPPSRVKPRITPTLKMLKVNRWGFFVLGTFFLSRDDSPDLSSVSKLGAKFKRRTIIKAKAALNKKQ